MAKKKEEGDTETGNEEGAQTQESDTTAEAGSESDDLKRAGGRTIARWKQQVFAELPEGNDQQIAERMNQIAHEEGYDYRCSPAAIARWRQAEPAKVSGDSSSGGQEEGHAYVVLRQLVYLLGKDVVKKLIDSL
jgi:hypothetical protein